jgi:hypothetical protein
MKLRTLALAALALSLALPAAANGRRQTQLGPGPAAEALRAEIVFQAELARPVIGDFAADLLQERARLAKRISQLEFVAEDGFLVTEDVLNSGRDAGELLLHSPSALLQREKEPHVNAARKRQVTLQRGSWMDSPDEAH